MVTAARTISPVTRRENTGVLVVMLIFLNTGINAMFPDTTVAKVFKFVGSPLAALLAGCLFSLVLTGAEWRSKKVKALVAYLAG